jgi:type III secretion protein R
MDFAQFTPATVLITIILVGIAPFVAVMVTSFTKIVVVLSLLRNALGLQQTPPNIVLNGLALILTIYVMYPTGTRMVAAVATSQASLTINSSDDMLAIGNAAKEPLRDFLLKHTPKRELAFFTKTAQRVLPEDARADFTSRDFIVVVPAFTVSELSSAFQIGFLIFLPFLVIDLVVSNILMSMGMMMLSPTTVSLPFKLLLFVLVDGWVKLSHGLVLSYAGG